MWKKLKNLKWNKDMTLAFFRTGLTIMSLALLLVVGIKVMPGVQPASSSSAKELPIYCVNTEKPQVALTFDAAWGNEDTSAILEILNQYGVKVTFFMTGSWMENYPEDVKAIAAAGHEIGNHSQSHKQMSKLDREECLEELSKPHEMMKKLLSTEMTLFRAPYGDYNKTLLKAVKEAGYHCVQWDVDSEDWKDYGVESIISKVLSNKHLGSGSIILMHNGAKYTKDALPSVIEGLKKKGYELVPVSQLIYTENYYMDHEGRQFQK